MVRLLLVGYPSVSHALAPDLRDEDGNLSSLLVTYQAGQSPFLQTTPLPFSAPALTPYLSTLDAILLAELSLVPSDCLGLFHSHVVLTGASATVTAQLLTEFASFYRITEDVNNNADELIRLRDAQALLSSIIHSTQDAISVVDKEGCGLLINPAYTRLTGYQPSDVIGQPAEFDIAEGESMHMRVLQTGHPVKNIPLKVGPKRREVIVNVAPFYVDEELRGSVGVIHDVSEITHLTEELAQANRLLRSVQAKYTFDDVIGSSPAIRLAVEQARRGSPTPATVLLRGESGTGKELFAHAIHHESQRATRPFIRVNCAALSETLLESELFGYEEGAFTGARRGGRQGLFEEASDGTLFLDEIGELTPATQTKLLRALQEREIVRVGGVKSIPVDVRVIAATHIHLEQAVAKGTFREDLYYRLNVLPIVIPPLRYRKEDIEALAVQIIQKHNQAYGRNVEHLSDAAVRQLESYDWPGNVRELENTLGRAMIHMDYRDQLLEERHLPSFQSALPAEIEDAVYTSNSKLTLVQQVHRMEQRVIQTTLKAVGGNKTEAARRLGISVRTLYYKLGDLND